MQIPLSTKISVETYQWLENYVKENDLKKAHIVEAALQDYKKKTEKKKPGK